MRYGTDTEAEARKKYQQSFDVRVEQSGMVICDIFSWLSSSPDGLIVKENNSLHLIEIKCPFKCKNKNIEDLNYLDKGGNLKRTHTYFCQIQLSMWICKCETATLYIYSSVDQKAIDVPIDQEYV